MSTRSTPKRQGQIDNLVEEIIRLEDLGDMPRAEGAVRTLDDLAGYYRRGRFIGGASFVTAARKRAASLGAGAR